jgi:hypothetical protein
MEGKVYQKVLSNGGIEAVIPEIEPRERSIPLFLRSWSKPF